MIIEKVYDEDEQLKGQVKSLERCEYQFIDEPFQEQKKILHVHIDVSMKKLQLFYYPELYI